MLITMVNVDQLENLGKKSVGKSSKLGIFQGKKFIAWYPECAQQWMNNEQLPVNFSRSLLEL